MSAWEKYFDVVQATSVAACMWLWDLR